MTDNSKSDDKQPASSKTEAEARPAKADTKAADTKPAKADTGPKTEIKLEAKAAKKKTTPKPQHAKTGGGNYLAKLALLSSLIIAGGVFYLWRYHTDALEGQQQRLAELQTVIQDRSESLQQFDEALKGELGTLQDRQEVVTEAVDELLKTSRHLRHEWLVAEAEYLVNLASHRLILAQDVNTAISALKAGDDRLRETGDPSLIVLRKAIAEDVNNLKAVALPDITGLSLQLNALVQDVDDLPLLTPEPESAAQQQTGPARPPVENWRELPAAMWEDMKKLVIIRDHQGPIKPLLSPEQHFFLSQNLKLQLEQARLALLTGENEVYHERLETAQDWISNWFDPENNRTINMLEQLKQLAAVDVQPSLPELTRTYQALEAYHAKRDTLDAVEAATTDPVGEPKPETETAPEAKPETKPENTLPTPANPQVPL
jgi:uroporphyrin-3 C-methyltransferase